MVPCSWFQSFSIKINPNVLQHNGHNFKVFSKNTEGTDRFASTISNFLIFSKYYPVFSEIQIGQKDPFLVDSFDNITSRL